MKTAYGIKVIEFNARFGDPETEVVLPLLESDIFDIFSAVAEGRPAQAPVWSDDVTMGVVLASNGYPGSCQKGYEIECPDEGIYHMGTAVRDGRLVTNGGRVMMCVARASSLKAAKEKAYSLVDRVKCENLFHRNDIAHQAFEV